MNDIHIGDVVAIESFHRVIHAEIVTAKGHYSTPKAKKGEHRAAYVFLLLGFENRQQPLDYEKALKRIGWTNDATDFTRETLVEALAKLDAEAPRIATTEPASEAKP